MNILQLIGDQLHLFALILLVVKIIKTRSCAGISGKSQILYALVYSTRYLGLATIYISAYNTSMKLAYLSIAYITIFLIYVIYKKTYEHENDTCQIEYIIISVLLLALLFNYEFSFMEVFWAFSIYLEAVAIIPQLVFVLKAGEIDKVVFIYLCCMAAYRSFFYVLNWAYRYYAENHYDVICISATVVETIIYCDFFIRGLRTIKRKKAYHNNLQLILNSPENFVIGDKSLQKEKQPDYQDFQKVPLDVNDYSDNKTVDLVEIPKVHM